MNFTQLIEQRGTDPATRQRVFIRYRDDEEQIHNLTYAEFYERALQYGQMIQGMRREKRGSDSRDGRFHVGVYLQNVPEFLYILGGCSFSGATLVGINNAQVGEKLAIDINRMDIEVLFVDDASHKTGETLIERVMEAKERYGFDRVKKRDIVIVSGRGSEPLSGISTLSEKLAEYSDRSSRPWSFDENATGVIIFTSGTTGAPKGIEVSWKKLIDVAITTSKLLNYTADDIGYICMPLNHSNSLYLNLMPAILNGAQIGLRRKFSASRFVRDLEEYRATVWNCVGDPVQYVLNLIGDRDYSHLPLRIVISTGTPPDNREKFSRIFGLQEFKEVYGSTEVGAISAVTPDSPRVSVGRLLREIKVVREDDPAGTVRECALAVVEGGRIKNFERSVGEIVVSQESLGPSRFTGYYNMPEESKTRVDRENYFHMGDLGAIVEVEDRRYLIFLGRIGDWIRCKGENWAAIDVENIIARYEGVTLAAVIGIPQADGREDDSMFILETDDPARFDPGAFYAWCVRELPHYTLPRFIRVVRSLPQTDTIKTQKMHLRREFFKRTPKEDSDPHDELFEIVEGRASRFTTEDYQKEIARYKDPTAQDRLTIFVGGRELFRQEWRR
jgi:fatty-acyl-CoA synthase